MKTGELIGVIAKERGISLRQLAIDAEIPYNTLYAIVKRKSTRIDSDTLQKIAAALNIPLIDLMDLSPAEREQLERDALSQEATNRLMDALDASDGAMIEAFKDIPDANIKAHLTAIVDDELTREGQILTLKRAYELSMQQKYNRWPTERKTPQA